MKRTILRLTRPAALPEVHYRLPGSKSYTNRALVIAAYSRSETVLRYPSLSNDSLAMLEALRKIGVQIEQTRDQLTVDARRLGEAPFRGTIDVGPAGTTMRFLVSLCSFLPGVEVTLVGSERMHERPISDLVDALSQCGARIEYLGRHGCPPLRITGALPAENAAVAINGNVSSQFFSSLLMAGPLMPRGLKIEVLGEQISRSYIDMTLHSMAQFGVTVQNHDYRSYHVAPGQQYQGGTHSIEGDASGASYLWSIAAMSGGTVRVSNVRHDSRQGDMRYPDLLEKMGCLVTRGTTEGSDWIEVSGRELSGIETDMTLMPDTAQTLSVVASLARGRTRITGLSTLKVKETDRLLAVHTELKKAGISSQISNDSIEISGGVPRPARFATYEDHRMAMSFALFALVLPSIEIEDPEVVAKSFPEFWDFFARAGVEKSLVEE
jgi:3-phosphoshikimate 1-carboxyvinyltransferase